MKIDDTIIKNLYKVLDNLGSVGATANNDPKKKGPEVIDSNTQTINLARPASRPYKGSRKITFDNASHTLNNNALVPLNNLAGYLIQHPEVAIEITAHTDTKGSIASNNILSANRANSVVEYLKSLGVKDKQLIDVTSYGEHNLPVKTGDNKDEVQNRCCTFKLTKSGIDVSRPVTKVLNAGSAKNHEVFNIGTYWSRERHKTYVKKLESQGIPSDTPIIANKGVFYLDAIDMSERSEPLMININAKNNDEVRNNLRFIVVGRQDKLNDSIYHRDKNEEHLLYDGKTIAIISTENSVSANVVTHNKSLQQVQTKSKPQIAESEIPTRPNSNLPDNSTSGAYKGRE